MEDIATIFVVFVLVWNIAFPLIYGQLLSRLFGLHKKLDHWILFFLHISVVAFSIIFFALLVFLLSGLDLPDAARIIIPPALVPAAAVAVEGLVWQYYLKDRKMNGFLISLICNAAYIIPYSLLIIAPNSYAFFI